LTTAQRKPHWPPWRYREYRPPGRPHRSRIGTGGKVFAALVFYARNVE